MALSAIGAAVGPLISGGLSLAGSLFSDEAQRENVERQLAFQRETQQNSIQWRVADAQKAGIHPLFALGANTPSTFPVAMDTSIGEGLRDMGQSVGGAVTRMLDTQAKEKHQMDMALGAAQLEESDARKQMYLSEAARNRQQPAAPMPGLGVQREGKVSVGPQMEIDGQTYEVPGTGAIDLKPVDQLSSKLGNPDVTAGLHPGYEERLFRGMPMLFPQSAGESPEEIISEMSLPAYLGLLILNQNTYGGNWMDDFMKMRYLGQAQPSEYYSPLAEHSRRGKYYAPLNPLQRAVQKALGVERR